jgi:hypothetical protein
VHSFLRRKNRVTLTLYSSAKNAGSRFLDRNSPPDKRRIRVSSLSANGPPLDREAGRWRFSIFSRRLEASPGGFSFAAKEHSVATNMQNTSSRGPWMTPLSKEERQRLALAFFYPTMTSAETNADLAHLRQRAAGEDEQQPNSKHYQDYMNNLW